MERVDVYPTRTYAGHGLRAGKPFPFGATLVPGGANFSISDQATAVAGDPERQGPALPSVTANPAHPPVTFRYDLGQPTRVSPEVFDVRGRRVRVLDDGERVAGAHSVAWDGTDGAGMRAGEGLYFFRLRAGRFEMTRRVMLVN